MTLHERLLAEIERREGAVRGVHDSEPGRWHVYRDSRGRIWVRDKAGDNLAEVGVAIDAEHMAEHDPADALRRYAYARRVLERHRARPCGYAYCRRPQHMLCDDHSAYDADECPEIRDLAESLGVPIEEA